MDVLPLKGAALMNSGAYVVHASHGGGIWRLIKGL
jgi:hypothetical protein